MGGCCSRRNPEDDYIAVERNPGRKAVIRFESEQQERHKMLLMPTYPQETPIKVIRKAYDYDIPVPKKSLGRNTGDEDED